MLCFSNDENGLGTSPEPSSWVADPMTFISAAERVKLGRRRKKEGEEVTPRERSRRYSTEVKTMITKIEVEKRQVSKARKQSDIIINKTEDGPVEEDEEDADRLVIDEQTDEDESKLNEESKLIEISKLIEAALIEATETEITNIINDAVVEAAAEVSAQVMEKVERAVEAAFEAEVAKSIDEASSSVEENIDRAADRAVEDVVEDIAQTIVEAIVSVEPGPEPEPDPVQEAIPETFGADVAKIIKEIPSPTKVVKDLNLKMPEESDSDVERKKKKSKKKDKEKRRNSEDGKPPKEKGKGRKSSRFSVDEEESSGSWSCTILTPEVLESPAKEKPSKSSNAPFLIHSTLQLPTGKTTVVDEVLCSPPMKPTPAVVDLTDSLTESADFKATQALLEEISLSVLGVRFRCPLCSFVDEQVRGVREHMGKIHKCKELQKAKVKSPVRQDMRVRLKHPRVHKDTITSALNYYKAFGGLFFASHTKANIKFWGKEIPRIRDLSASGRIPETPAKKKIGPKTWMIENKLLTADVLETPVSRRGLGRPGLKRRPKPQDFEVPVVEEPMPKVDRKSFNDDISQVHLLDEIDLDVQNQLLANADGASNFVKDPSNFEENLTGLETVSVDSDFDIKNDIDTRRSRRRKSDSLKKVLPLKVKAIKKKITLTKNKTSVDSVWQAVESDTLYNTGEAETPPANPLVGKLRNGEIADDDDSEIENKVPKTGIAKKGRTPATPKDELRSRTKTRKMSRLQQLNASSLNSSRSSSRESESVGSGVPAHSETESVKSLHLRLSSDTERSDQENVDSGTGESVQKAPSQEKNPEVLRKAIISIIASAAKVPKKPGEETPNTGRSRGPTPETDKVTADTSAISKTNGSEKLKEPETVTKTLRGFRKTPWKSIDQSIEDSADIDDKKKRKYSKKGKKMEIPAEMQLPEGSNRYSRSARGKKRQGEALQELLTLLLNRFQERDVNEWFSVPINDKIAPGYSAKVKEPMDFTAMENKLDTRVYGTVEQFIYDFKLVCNNCLAYHKPDTCYYKAGRKLHHYGRQLLSKRNLKEMVEESPGVFAGLTPFELGFDPMGEFEEEEELNGSFHDDSSFSQSPTRLVDLHEQGNEEGHAEGHEEGYDAGVLYPTDQEGDWSDQLQDAGVYMTAAERVKFGRRRGQSVQLETPTKTQGKRKKVDENGGGVKRMKTLEETGREYDMTPITGEDAIPESSLYHHDYFGYTRNEVDQVPEDADPVSRAAKEKLRTLQLQRAGGTYVQCCKETCKKWRFLTEFEDPSLVPEYWVCSMSQDKKLNRCSTREGEQVEEDEEFVNVKFTAGSLVWARVKGYPWWPAMVDYCPDSEEYYWIEEDESRIEPAWYHVVFLEKQVSRSWVRKELVEKMTTVQTPPKNLAVRKNNASQKRRLVDAITMATQALGLSLESRLKKYSFASLFNGKWGDYSDISSADDGGLNKDDPKNSQKIRSSVDSPEKKAYQSGLETFECSKCGEKVIYTKFLVQKHLKKHRLDLKEYVLKFDPAENNDRFVLIREWIDRDEFHKAIAEDPWKPNIGEQKGSSSDTDRLRTIEETVSEQSPKTYLDPAESEEFHVQSSAARDETSSYGKPLLSNDSLIAVAVRNLDPANKNGATFREIVAFISLHFPYYDLHMNTCRYFVKKAYGLKNPDEEQEPAGTFRIRPAVVQRLYADISPILQKDKVDIEKSMLHPKFLDVMVQRFLEGENFHHPRQSRMIPYNLKQLSLLTFMALRHPASLEQIIIYLLFLFPAFCSQQDSFRKNFGDEVSREPEVEIMKQHGEDRFVIKKEAYTNVVKNLRVFTAIKKVFEDLQSSIFDEDFINVLFPGLKVTEEGPMDLTTQSISTSFSSVSRHGTLVATNIVAPVQGPYHPVKEVKPPVPCDILVYYIAILEERAKKQMTTESIVSQLKAQFEKWNNKDFKFVNDVLNTNVYVKAVDDTFQISPQIKSFGTAVLMKFIIENLDDMSSATSTRHHLKSILPRIDEGSAKLQSDFCTQTRDFSKKKCLNWRPPMTESMLLDLAIMATVDMNDTASLSGVVSWVREHFPWYNLTRQQPFASIPERIAPSCEPESPLSLSPTDMLVAKQQVQRLAVSCRPQLTSIMTRPEVLNCVLEPGTGFPEEERRYTRPPFPDGVMVGLALLHIGDELGWASSLSILKFVELNFPFYEGEMATRFLSNISSWLTKMAEDAEYFKVEQEPGGIMPRYQIRPDRILTCFAWMGKYVTFDKESEAVNQLFMRSPPLLKEILSLPPPDWAAYYRPKLAPTIRATPLSKMLAPTSAPRVVATLPSVAPTGPVVPIVSVAPLEAQWIKPPMETHLMIAMALILKDCKQFQEQEYDYAPPEDLQVSQFSLEQKNSLQQLLQYMREAFPYYEAKDNIREFVINDIQNNKDMVSQFFNLAKNQENKLEYEFKPSAVAHVYEEVLGLADWAQIDSLRTWLRTPRNAETAFAEKAPLSESNILALILFLHGDDSSAYSLCIESIINVMINEVGVATAGLSGQRWGESRLRRFLRETILKLEANGDHFHRDLSHPTLHLALRTEEGRLDELFANLQKSVFDIMNKPSLTENLRLFLGKFMEMPTPL